MRAVAVSPAEPGQIPGPDSLHVVELDDPTPASGEVVVDVAAAGLNRADLLQRMGFYPPPPGASDVIGLECSGIVSAVGAGVTRWQVGDEVCCLLAGGAYASKVAVPEGQCLPVPGVSLEKAAALPEVAATVWSNLFMIARVQPHETVLIHGGAGGVGSFALQLLRARGIRVIATASAGKLDACRGFGAEVAIDYAGDWVAEVQALGGADVILDVMGAAYLEKNLTALRDGGRIVVIGLQGGVRGEVDLNALMRKRASLIGTTLRSRSVESKSEICAEVEANVWPLVAAGEIEVPIDSAYALEDAAAAHRRMESGSHVGKLILTMGASKVDA
ncbi:NAD(P)H-quinone oxidoreductase [Nocardioides baekrokdamisoli]|nr:NAD(P)H-quinone oxidoreductase [Nocardioides baekrokdamisoli]